MLGITSFSPPNQFAKSTKIARDAMERAKRAFYWAKYTHSWANIIGLLDFFSFTYCNVLL